MSHQSEYFHRDGKQGQGSRRVHLPDYPSLSRHRWQAGKAPLLIVDSVRKDGQRFSFVVQEHRRHFVQVNHLGRSGQSAWDIMTEHEVAFQFPPLLGRR